MSTHEVDYQILHRRLEDKRNRMELSWRQVAAELDLPPGTFTRLRTGKGISVDTFATLVGWLGMDESIKPFLKRGGVHLVPEAQWEAEEPSEPEA